MSDENNCHTDLETGRSIKINKTIEQEFEEAKSLYEAYGRKSVTTFDEWKTIKLATLRATVAEQNAALTATNKRLPELMIEVERLRIEKADAENSYETLTGLLRKRFPARPDGTYPDYKIEDVLRENAEQAKRISELLEWQGKQAKALAYEIKSRIFIGGQLAAEREKNKQSDCRRCEHCDDTSNTICDDCRWHPALNNNYKEAVT